MEKIKLGIIGAADIAYRRFLPSLIKSESFEYVGVASRNVEKTKLFIDEFGGKGFRNYDEMICDEDIDAVYIPLPPALHYEWAKKALEKGKHVFLEKPSTTSYDDTKSLIDIANSKKLAIHENYMFMFHSQIHTINKIIREKTIGDIRLFRVSFGFPMRGIDDFRYNKDMGGGAFLDCGGYTVKLATYLLGDSAIIKTSKLNYEKDFEVDLYGTVTMENEKGITAQLCFGMDNSYKCDLEIWGSKGCATMNRIFTAPSNFQPELIIQTANDKQVFKLDSDDQFLNSIDHFYSCIKNEQTKKNAYKEILLQSNFVEEIIKLG